MSAPLNLGDLVGIEGRVIGRSEFASGSPTILVQFDLRGKKHQEWFYADELFDIDDSEETANA